MIYNSINKTLNLTSSEMNQFDRFMESKNIPKIDFQKQSDVDFLCQITTFHNSINFIKNVGLMTTRYLNEDSDKQDVLANQVKNVFDLLFRARENHKNIVFIPDCSGQPFTELTYIDRYNISKNIILSKEQISYRDLNERFSIEYDEAVREAVQALSGEDKMFFCCPKFYANDIFVYGIAKV